MSTTTNDAPPPPPSPPPPPTTHLYTLSPLENMIAGGTSGVMARSLVAPLDVIKIRYQLQTVSGQYYRSIPQTIYKIAREEGVTALWKGNFIGSLMASPYTAIAFSTQQFIKSTLTTAYAGRQHGYAAATNSTTTINNPSHSTSPPAPNPNPYLSTSSTTLTPPPPSPVILSAINATSGAAAGLVATSTTYPLDLLRSRFIAQHSQNKGYSSLWHAVSSIHAQAGLAGFFTGVTPALVGIVPYMAIQFLLYEGLKSTIIAHLAQIDAVMTRRVDGLFATMTASGPGTGSVGFNPNPSSALGTSMTSGASTGATATATAATGEVAAVKTKRGFGMSPLNAEHALRWAGLDHWRTKAVVPAGTMQEQVMDGANTQSGQETAAPTTAATLNSNSHLPPQSSQQQQQAQSPPPAIPLWIVPFVGLVAGATGKAVSFPFDMIKRRMQMSGFNHSFDPLAPPPTTASPSTTTTTTTATTTTSFLSTLRQRLGLSTISTARAPSIRRVATHIYTTEGPRAFYKGLVPALIKSGPSASLSFFFFELVSSMLRKMHSQQGQQQQGLQGQLGNNQRRHNI